MRRRSLGSREMWLWWGGLAGAAVIGVLEWPVAAAVGIGSYVAAHARPGLRGDEGPTRQGNESKPATAPREQSLEA